MTRYKRKKEGIDWDAVKKGIDQMFPPASKKRKQRTQSEGVTQDKNGYPISDTETKKRGMERYRKRKETQRE